VTVVVNARDVQRLREETGAGVMECKRALEKARGDFERAKEILRESGISRAQKKAGREAREGVVEAYIHGNGRIGVLVEVNSETDFVARSPEFRELAKAIAMQIAAMSPEAVSADEIPAARREELKKDGVSDQDIARLGLLDQPYIRDESKTVRDLVTALAARVGENIRVRRFSRYQLGS
jgi:elongation factor Ts